MILGLNHVTFAVADLDRSVRFYGDVLGFRLAHRWARGAYLDGSGLWLALALDPGAAPATGGTHLALSVGASDFDAARRRVLDAGAPEWRENRSEGPSLYVCDPDGHRLELHVGSLASRLRALGVTPVDEDASDVDGKIPSPA